MGILITELRLFASRLATARSLLLHLVLLLAFGVWIPRMKDLDFLDTQVLGAYACLGLIFAGPATAQAFSDGVSSFKQALARIFVGVLYGEFVVALLLGAGVGTIYFIRRGGYVPTPDWETIGKAAALGFAAALLLASLAAWVTVRFSRQAAMICLRVAFFGLLVLFYYKGRWLPDVGLMGAGVCLAATIPLLVLLRKDCH